MIMGLEAPGMVSRSAGFEVLGCKLTLGRRLVVTCIDVVAEIVADATDIGVIRRLNRWLTDR